MKFNSDNWNEAPYGSEINAPRGPVQLRLSRPGALFAEIEGVETLVGYGAEFSFDLSQEAVLTVDADMPVRIFYSIRRASVTTSEGEEIFTNLNRKPHESGSLNAVMIGARQIEIAKRQMRLETAAAIERAVRQALSVRRSATTEAERKAPPPPPPPPEGDDIIIETDDEAKE